MNNLMQNVKTMSSREIADSTNKEHSHVIRDIRLMLSQIDDPNMDDVDFKEIFDNRGYTSEIRLNKNLTFTLIAGYNSKVRYRIVKRWQELEQQTQASQPVIAMPDFTNPAEAARAFADQYEAKQIAQEQLALAQPKVDFYNTVAASSSTMAVGDVAKKIGMSAQELNKKLVEIGAYDKRRLPKKVFNDGFIRKGYAEMSLTQDGYDRNRLTQAGQIYVTGLFGRSREVESM